MNKPSQLRGTKYKNNRLNFTEEIGPWRFWDNWVTTFNNLSSEINILLQIKNFVLQLDSEQSILSFWHLFMESTIKLFSIKIKRA